LVPLCTDFCLAGGGATTLGVLVAPPLFAVEGAFLAANFSFLAFCVQSGQVTSLALAD
jgi:hypothetical protein